MESRAKAAPSTVHVELRCVARSQVLNWVFSSRVSLIHFVFALPPPLPSHPHDLTNSQCNQLNPACSQCLRAGKECPGYRDQLSLMFRDENDRVVTKARAPKVRTTSGQRKRNPRLTSGSNPRAATPSINESQGQTVVPIRLPLPSLTRIVLEDEGIRFFFNHYSPLGTPQSATDQELRIRNSPILATSRSPMLSPPWVLRGCTMSQMTPNTWL